MHSCALATFGKKNTKSSDWFEAKSKELDPIISNKRQKQCEYNKPEKRPSRWSGVVPMITGWSLVNALKMLLLQAILEPCMKVLRPLQALLRANLPP
jgi:hypothetical protein